MNLCLKARAKKGKYAMENFTPKVNALMNLTQFETTIWAKYNTQWQWS